MHGSSVEQYTGCVVIPQYCFLIPPNFMNTAIPQRIIILFFQFVLCKNKICVPK